MSNLEKVVEDTIVVEYSQFLVQETSMRRSPLASSVPQGGWVVVGASGGLLLHSAATDHYPVVRLELWDGAPPLSPEDWDHVVEVTCDIDSAVRLQSVTATYSERSLPIARSGTHHARVHAGNQAETAELDEGTLESGVERWLIQLWKA